MLSRSNHLNVLRYCPKINFWWTYDIFTRKIRSSRSFKDQNAWFLLIFPLFLDILTFIWPWLFYLDILYIFLSLADDLSVILYQNNEVTSTSNPTIHIHIKKHLWKQLIRFPAFSFFESHHFFSEVSPDNKVTHARCSKPSEIVQNQILVFVLTISKIVWSVLNQMFTLLHLFLPENHCFFKHSRKNSKNLQKNKTL